jgi:hypothetical protein
MVNIFNVQKPRDNFAPVPAGLVAPMLIRIKRDQATNDVLTQSASSDARYLNAEITLADGPHKGAKIFARLVVEGSSDGAKTATSISLGLVSSIARSAMGLRSDDMGPAAEATLSDFKFEDLDGTQFIGRTGKVERGKLRDPSQGPNGERYDDRATLERGVTPDMGKDWEQWKHAPRGFGLNAGSSPNGPGDSGAVIDVPPWAD